MISLVMVFLGIILTFSWGKYHLEPKGRHTQDDNIPTFIHILWLIVGLVLLFSSYVYLAVN